MNGESADSSKTCSLAGQRIVQLHPSLRCNLCCEHCYSSSGPWVRSELDPAVVCGMVSDAARMGYQVASVSGGEPFLYSGLSQVLRHAKSVGLRTTVTTNGYFLQPRWLEPLRDCVDVLAISLDGPPDLHNKMRRSRHAFDRLCAGLEHLRVSGLSFGFIHTLTRETWEHMVWLAEFAAGHGASLLQLHPLELAGRAEEKLSGARADEDISARAYLLAFALALKYNGSMTIQIDLLHRDQVLSMPGLVYADELGTDWNEIGPARLLSLIVMEADGTVVPISYGFSRQYQICNLIGQSLSHGWASFLCERYPAIGWLAREGKVVLTPKKRSLSIRLK
jgi:Fe-coproporphyrin III synthase